MSQKPEIAGIESSYRGTGLKDADVQVKQKQYGINEIPEKHVGSVMGTLKRMWGPISWLLEAAMIFELILGKGTQAAVVFLLLVFSAITGQIQEGRAKKAIGYLHHQLQISVRVLRNGTWQTLPSRKLVPGDIVHVRVGDIVPADMEIISGIVSVNESALTGESIDVTKNEGKAIFSASTISHGEAIANVIAIGEKSSYGKTAELIRTAEAPGRLQILLFNIVRYLAYLDVILAVILVITAFISGTSWQELLPFLVILFVATIPISMPSSFTVANSLEAQNLAKEHVLITGLTGIQEAASLNILLVDKTGTLTNNCPEIAGLLPFGGLRDSELLQLAVAASDDTSNETISIAIIRAFQKHGLPMLERMSFTAFDPVHKVSKAQIRQSGGLLNVVLGSPLVVARMSEVPADFTRQVNLLSAKGARVLAVAAGNSEKLICRGLIALADSPRDDAKESIAKIKKLGIRILMVTGDTTGTAKAIAEQVGIAVSDATDVAKSAAKVVLTEPGLSNITKVIDSGHRVYRRMMTWTITKLARTAELAALLTFGFIFTRFFPVSLSLIVFIIVMNDMVTLTLGTDKAWPTSVPEKWDMPQLAKISAIFTMGWLALGLGLLWLYLKVQHLGASQISSLMFVYLIYSAMETILMTRTRDPFWSFATSKWVGGMVAINFILATLMAVFGWVMDAVSWQSILILFAITVVAMLVLDGLKVWYYKMTGILGTERHTK